uniref:Uncharacterized protein n=1 Tax=Mycena chlorophos TaxID=658473 RepID=A0ABQ0M483_MYCCL|nr:predicted protein [Mycena chlorophos]
MRLLLFSLFAPLVLAEIPVSYTPSGTRIFSVPKGSHLRQSGSDLNVVAEDGTISHVFENLMRGRPDNGPTKRQSLSVPVDATTSLPDNSTILSFNSTLVVPPLPTTFNSQIMFFTYGALFDDDGELFLSAGLQYGGTEFQGGPYWTLTIMSESVPQNLFLPSYLGNPIVYPGDVLNMSISVSPISEFGLTGLWEYTLGFNNDPDLTVSQVFQSPAPTSLLFRAQEEGVSQASDYPAGSVLFQDVSLVFNTTTGPSTASVSWTTDTNSTVQPGVEIKVDGNGSRDSQITIVFPDSA